MTDDLPRLACSVRQPWAWAIVYGAKDFENRTKYALSLGGYRQAEGQRIAVGKLLLDLWFSEDEMNEKLARSMLAQVGLGLIRRDGPRNWWLAILEPKPADPAMKTSFTTTANSTKRTPLE